MTVAEVIANHQLLKAYNENHAGIVLDHDWVCACGTQFKRRGQEGYKEWAAHVAAAALEALADDLESGCGGCGLECPVTNAAVVVRAKAEEAQQA